MADNIQTTQITASTLAVRKTLIGGDMVGLVATIFGAGVTVNHSEKTAIGSYYIWRTKNGTDEPDELLARVRFDLRKTSDTKVPEGVPGFAHNDFTAVVTIDRMISKRYEDIWEGDVTDRAAEDVRHAESLFFLDSLDMAVATLVELSGHEAHPCLFETVTIYPDQSPDL